MEADGETTPSKPSKITSSAQETPAAPSYPDWSGSLQAYYSVGAPAPIFASPVAAPSPHPFVWGGQHPLISPYGTPVPYPAIYPPAATYVHPNMQTAKAAQCNTELEGKSQDSNAAAKKSKGNSVLGSSKAGENGRAASGSGNGGGASLSGESVSDESLDASDENNNLASSSKKGSFSQMLADGVSHNHDGGASIQTSVMGMSVPATNLKIGMGSWNGTPADTMKVRADNGVTTCVAHDHQDERELKRQKRKQSNRESARRSRLRKQAECEELQRKVDSLAGENQSLTQELQRLAEECNKLTAENTSIKEELTQLYGPEIIDAKNHSQGACKSNG